MDEQSSNRPTVGCLFCHRILEDGAPGTCTIAIHKPGRDGVWYGAHDACLRKAAHEFAPLTILEDVN